MIDNLVRENIKALQPYSSARKEFTGSMEVMLDANELPFGNLNRYPDPQQIQLKQLIGANAGVALGNVFLGNGSDEIIDLLIRIFCEPGKDKIAFCSPTYGMYTVNAAINNVQIIDVPLNQDFQIDIATLLNKTSNTNCKILFICSPNNPTGNSIENIDEILENFNGIVVVDEAYIDFSNKQSFVRSIKTNERLLVLQTMSKSRGLAAARIGIAFAGIPVIEYLNKVKPPYNISLLNQQAAITAMLDEKGYEANLKTISQQKETLMELLKTCKCVEHIYPSDANFYLVRFKNANSTFKTLLAQGIVVRNREKEIPGCLRITVGTEAENTKLINVLQAIQ